MAKSVTSLIFGRAMELGLVSPDDAVGGLVPEADGAHGDIRLRDLLEDVRSFDPISVDEVLMKLAKRAADAQ